MGSPLQQRSYELALRVANVFMMYQGGGMAAELHQRLFTAATELGSWTERAAGASSRDVFRSCLYEVNTTVRLVKLWLRLLDDLGEIEPESAAPLHDLAEEIHRLCLAALRTSKDAHVMPHQNGAHASVP